MKEKKNNKILGIMCFISAIGMLLLLLLFIQIFCVITIFEGWLFTFAVLMSILGIVFLFYVMYVHYA